LGIGATTAIFSVINTVLLQPLPYDNRERIAFVTGDLSARNVKDFPMAPADFHDLRTMVKSFDEVAGLNTFQQPLFDDRARRACCALPPSRRTSSASSGREW
jgi:hypothetical protein